MKTYNYIFLFLTICLIGCTNPNSTGQDVNIYVVEIPALETVEVDKSEPPEPIQLTKEEDDALVAAGILPPLEEEPERK